MQATLEQLPKPLFRKRYHDIVFDIPVSKRKNFYIFTFEQPEKLFRGKYAYYYKMYRTTNIFDYSPANERETNSASCFDNEKELLKSLKADITHYEAINQNSQTYKIELTVPYTKHFYDQLQRAEKDSRAKNDIVLTNKLFKGKYSNKITIKLKSTYGLTPIQKVEEFVKNFEPIFTLYNYQQSSDDHEFTQSIVNKYETCKKYLNSKRKVGPVPKIQGNFTTYLASKEEMSTLLFYIDKSFKLVSTTEVRKPEVHKYVKKD